MSGQQLLKLSSHGGAEELRKLLLAGASVHQIDAQGSGTLHRAARTGNKEGIEVLVEHKADVNARDRKMVTALHEAASAGHANCVKALLESGAQVAVHKTNSSVTNGGFTPLHFAAAAGNTECVNLLIQAQSDIRGGDRAGECPLHSAIRKDSLSIVSVLLQGGVEPWIQSDNGRTPLHVAGLHGRLECAKTLLKSAKDSNKDEEDGELRLLLQGDNGGSLALHEAAAGGHVDLLQLMIERKVNVDSEDTYGKTALLCAAQERHLEAVQFLLDRGAERQRDHAEVAKCLDGVKELEHRSFLHQAIVKVDIFEKLCVNAKLPYPVGNIRERSRKESKQRILRLRSLEVP